MTAIFPIMVIFRILSENQRLNDYETDPFISLSPPCRNSPFPAACIHRRTGPDRGVLQARCYAAGGHPSPVAGSTIRATTPNQVYKAAATLQNAKILRDAGEKVQNGFILSVTGGGLIQNKAEKKLKRL